MVREHFAQFRLSVRLAPPSSDLLRGKRLGLSLKLISICTFYGVFRVIARLSLAFHSETKVTNLGAANLRHSAFPAAVFRPPRRLKQRFIHEIRAKSVPRNKAMPS